MSAEAIASLTVRRIPFSHFSSFSALFRDYCESYARLSGFFAGDFRDRSARVAAVERAVEVDRDRNTVADVLLEQNERWGMGAATRRHIDAVRDPGSAVVVTGQQVGLFGGPLYTILKAVSTVQLAAQLSEESGRTIVPVFWLGAEDHDFDEMAGVHLLRQNEPLLVRYPHPGGANTGPVGRIRFSEEVDRLVDTIDEALAPTDFKPEVMGLLRESYHSGETFADAFARLMSGLLGDAGLVLMSSDDARLKRLAVPMYRRELEEPSALSDAVAETSGELQQSYHLQVQVRPINLFLFEDGGRYPLDFNGDKFELRGHGRSFDRGELIDLLDDSPELFSPNVVLRPLTQDLLLPTAAYVGGPGEISYFAQYRGAYDWARLPMPIIYPRASATLIESKVKKVLAKYDLDVFDFADDVDRLFQRVVVESMNVNLDDLFSEGSKHVHEAVNVIKQGLQDVDATLGKAAEATRSALMDELEKLKTKAVRLEKKNQEVVHGQLEKAHANLYPAGGLQERKLSVLYFLNKYSPGLVGDLLSSLSTDTSEHQVVEL